MVNYNKINVIIRIIFALVLCLVVLIILIASDEQDSKTIKSDVILKPIGNELVIRNNQVDTIYIYKIK